MAVILKRPRALFDLAEIWSYVAEDSVINADRLAARIDKAFKLLARRPGLGRARPELYPNLRSLVIDKYVVSISAETMASTLSVLFMVLAI